MSNQPVGGRVIPTQPLSRRQIGAQRRLRMRTRILQAAAQVIAHSGTERTTIDDFIVAAGVARGTFYNHFESRQALFDELWRSVGRDPFRGIAATAGLIACPVERFATMSRLVLMRAGMDATWGWLVLALSATAATLNDDLRAYPKPDLREAKLAGGFRYDDEAAATDLVVGTMRSGLRTMLEDGRDATYADGLCRMMLLALGVGEQEASRLSAVPLPELRNGVGP